MAIRAGTRRSALRSRWWHTCIAWYALLALAWPSLGPLPFLVHDFGHHLHPAGAHAQTAGDHDDDHGLDASSIPGSPTHPADHNCAECEVLKHLSRCVLPVLVLAICAPVVAGVAVRRVAVAKPVPPAPVRLPPARAPPIAIA